MSQRYLALLRGINVGGKNRLPMASLRELLGQIGATEVRTYIQSGNAVFAHSARETGELAQRISAAIAKAHGFAPAVWVLRMADFERAIAHNPFPEAAEEPKTLHLYCLESSVEIWNSEAAA
jgi:uncharacterized protein (DUF1697 family)